MKTTKFDIVDFLDSQEEIAAYLQAALDSGDIGGLYMAIGDVARARCINKIAKQTGLGRENFYKSFSGNRSPRFDTVNKALNGLGIKIQFCAQ